MSDKLPKDVICPRCNGTGERRSVYIVGVADSVYRCPECKGSGVTAHKPKESEDDTD